jgi:mannose-6-phosphate isomerase-like protein (cupin superfamily)
MAIEPSIFIEKKSVDDTLAQAPVQGKHNLEPFNTLTKNSNLPVNILEDKEFTGGVEIHRHEGDLWLCLEGEVTFICDGRAKDPKVKTNKDGMVNDLEIRATEIIGGKEYVLHAGDWLWIPPGQPHIHKTTTHARLIIIKIPATKVASLEECMGTVAAG